MPLGEAMPLPPGVSVSVCIECSKVVSVPAGDAVVASQQCSCVLPISRREVRSRKRMLTEQVPVSAEKEEGRDGS